MKSCYTMVSWNQLFPPLPNPRMPTHVAVAVLPWLIHSRSSLRDQRNTHIGIWLSPINLSPRFQQSLAGRICTSICKIILKASPSVAFAGWTHTLMSFTLCTITPHCLKCRTQCKCRPAWETWGSNIVLLSVLEGLWALHVWAALLLGLQTTQCEQHWRRKPGSN